MRPKNKKVLWLPLFMLVIVLALMLTAFGQMKELYGDTPATPADTSGLGFEDICWNCHVTGLRYTGFDTTFYCHGLPLTEGYNSRLYLETHLAWIGSTLNMPPELYLPPATETDVYVHIFGLALMPSIVNIPVGATVTWVNLDIDTSTFISAPRTHFSPFLRIDLDPGASFSYTFTRPGVFDYVYQLKSSEIARARSLLDTGGRIIVGDVSVAAPIIPDWYGDLVPTGEEGSAPILTPEEIKELFITPPELLYTDLCELDVEVWLWIAEILSE